ncbi:hypothetical protein TTHERM_00492930 (macronuclear) [Tetrahymena thermophila SB210]|uniref:Uncharacterized protein n=1 Tax=Tetrahymena thermophila (strain SB210) TaxID=312017 RepID=I7MLR7_TETTS|nr:hypothetical protein TTHERM_00492930 [Tetrahymena thermophila SB210]EAS02940.2 hypothetical protein TTHERM_00492930 [Tetrahymena thermophila SB210]|eukprot:XP_001023185.2 hypothetical protein TTHERM_00492930 [Tetrahymena thermophila SB210]
MKSPRQMSNYQSGNITNRVYHPGQLGEPQLLQYNVSNYIQLLVQQKNNNQQQNNQTQQPLLGNIKQLNIISNSQSNASQPCLILQEKQISQNSPQNVQLIGMNSSNSAINNQQQQQQQIVNQVKNIECNDINYLLKTYLEREKQIKLLRNLRKEYRKFENFKEKEFQAYYLNGYDTYVLSIKEEKQRVMQEESTIKKYFNIKADQLNLKIVVFNLINSILQANQISYNELLDQGSDYEANDLLKQTNKFKEEIHKFIYKNQFRLTSIIIYICNFSRARIFAEQERFDFIVKRHEDVYKDAIKQRQALQQAASKQHQQQKMQQLQKNLSQAMSNYKQINGIGENNQNINQIYNSVMGLNNCNSENRMQLKSAQTCINYKQKASQNNCFYQEQSSDCNILDLDADVLIREESDTIFNLNDEEQDELIFKSQSPNKIQRSFSNEQNLNIIENSNSAKTFKNQSKNLRIKQQISSAKSPSEAKSIKLNQANMCDNSQTSTTNTIKIINQSTMQIVPVPKNILGQQLQNQLQTSQNLKAKINNFNSQGLNKINVNNIININNSSIYQQIQNQLSLLQPNNQLNNLSYNNYYNNSLTSNINQVVSSLGPASTLSIKLAILKNEKQKKLFKKMISEYAISDITQRVKFKKFKMKKAEQQNQLCEREVEESFYHLTMQNELIYSSIEVNDTKQNIDKLFQVMLKQNNQIKNTVLQYCNQTKIYQQKITKQYKQKIVDYHKNQQVSISSGPKKSFGNIQEQNDLQINNQRVIQFQQQTCNYLIVDSTQQLENFQDNFFNKQALQLSIYQQQFIKNIKSKWVNQQFIQFASKDSKYLDQKQQPLDRQAYNSEHTSFSCLDNQQKKIVHSNSMECLSVKGINQIQQQRNLIIRNNNQLSSKHKESSPSILINNRYNCEDKDKYKQPLAISSPINKNIQQSQTTISTLQSDQTYKQNQLYTTQTTKLTNQDSTTSSLNSQKIYSETLPITNKISSILFSPPTLPPSGSQKIKKMKSFKENSKVSSIYQISEKTLVFQKQKSSFKCQKKVNQAQPNQQMQNESSQINAPNAILQKKSNPKLFQITGSTQNLAQTKQIRSSFSNKQSNDNSFDDQSSPTSSVIMSNYNMNNFKIKHINLNHQNSIQDLIKQNIASFRQIKHKNLSQQTQKYQESSQLKTEKSLITNEGENLKTLNSYKSQNFQNQNEDSFEYNIDQIIDENKTKLPRSSKSTKKIKTRPASNIERNTKSQKQKIKTKNKVKSKKCEIEQENIFDQDKHNSLFFKDNLINCLKNN